MVRKKSILKDAFREIKVTKKRFISLLLIITIGIGLYVGLKSTAKDMRTTANEYYKEANLMDIKVNSDVGLDKNDEIRVKNIEGIKGVTFTKTLDAETEVDGKNYVIKLNSINKNRSTKNDDYINRLVLTSGKYPSTINEGLVEERFLKDNDLSLNDLIILTPENENDLRAKKIKIVGTIKSSYYSSKNKGTSNIGNGKVDYYMYLEENEFGFDSYNEAFITIKNAEKLDTYSNEYEKYIDSYKDKIKSVVLESYNEKKQKNIEEIENNVNSIESSLNNIYSSDLPQDSLTDEIKTLSDELKNAKSNLSKVKNASIYVQTRNELSSFYEYKEEIEKIDNISKIFPLIFLLVTTFVVLASIMKIVEEQKVQIGILQTIGYSKFDILFKYLLYAAFVSLIGSAIGSLLFYKLLPKLVSLCYGDFYDMPSIITSFQIKHVLFASLFVILSTIIATLFYFFKNTLETPTTLMRPKTQKTGKKIFLEKHGKIWNKLSPFNKVIIKNIFKNKKRLLMEVIEIGGSITLLLASFGIHDSIKETTKIDTLTNKVNITFDSSNITIILILASSILLFVVLYNLSNIIIRKRTKELTTIKVLGFYDNEVTSYVSKEIIILTIIGTMLGLVFGSFLTYYVINNLLMFNFNISLISYILAFIIIMIFTFIVNLFTHFKLKKLDVASTLKILNK